MAAAAQEASFKALVGGGPGFDFKRAGNLRSLQAFVRREPRKAAEWLFADEPLQPLGAFRRESEAVAGPSSSPSAPAAAGAPAILKRKARGNGHAEAPAAAKPKKQRNPAEEDAALRKKYRIRVKGAGAPGPLRGFNDLRERYGVKTCLLKALQDRGFTAPSPVQRQAVPALLEGRDFMACAPTGSGKTLAYLLPVLDALCKVKKPKRGRLRALVVLPTKPLAQQIWREFQKCGAGSRVRGAALVSKGVEKGTDLGKVDVLFATPLRLGHMVQRGAVDLSGVRYLVLDEADKMLQDDGQEDGFLAQVDALLGACSHRKIVRCLFSATLPEQVEELARNVLRDPLRITVGERSAASDLVQQRLLYVGSEEGKLLGLRQLLSQGVQPPLLVFVQSQDRAEQLFKTLRYEKLNVDVLHGGSSAGHRDGVLEKFRLGTVWMLITTEVLGRGMDFKGVNMVVNYDCPTTRAEYIHRIGRTGRAGRRGQAVTLYTEADVGHLRMIASVMHSSGSYVQPWMLNLKKPRQGRRRTFEVQRDDILPRVGGGKKRKPRPAEAKAQAQAKAAGDGAGAPPAAAVEGAGTRKKKEARVTFATEQRTPQAAKPPARSPKTRSEKKRKGIRVPTP